MAPAVRVNAIAPGFVAGGLPSRVLDAERHETMVAQQPQISPPRRVSQPDEVVAMAHFLAARAPLTERSS